MPPNTRKIILDSFNEFIITGSSAGAMGKVYFLDPVDKPTVHHTPMGRTIHPFIGGIASKFPKNLDDSKIFERECEIWLNLKHRNIVPLLRIMEIGGVMAALMPLYHESLRDLILKPSDRSDSFWGNQLLGILDSLDYAWNYHGLLHLDLKPENILNYYEDRSPYLSIADWGMARYQDSCFSRLKKRSSKGVGSLEVYGGTLPYMSPQRIKGALFSSNYRHTLSDDIFSVGIILSEILLHYNPCSEGALSHEDIINRILSGEYYSPILKLNHKKRALARLAQLCCSPDLEERPNSYKKIIKFMESHVV